MHAVDTESASRLAVTENDGRIEYIIEPHGTGRSSARDERNRGRPREYGGGVTKSAKLGIVRER